MHVRAYGELESFTSSEVALAVIGVTLVKTVGV
jgi:hypothetical protein